MMDNLSRRRFLAQMTGVAGFTMVSRTALARGLAWQSDYVTVETQYGKLRGYRENGVSIFKGVPYAGKISGERRFRRPGELTPWTGVRDALQLGHPSIQVPNQTYGINEPKPDEDCLVLNIWTPATGMGKRPVMFYNHGGGFSTGSGGSVAQDGSNLARNFDVVVVETNHRLGLLGYLYLDELGGPDYAGSGNNGMLDIVDGLKWVHNNISLFGGDPENVMVFGESGGGAKTSCLYAMPAAAPFFNKASIESGPGVQMTPLEVAAETTAMLLKQLNLTRQDWRRLLDLPASDLLAMQLKLPGLPEAQQFNVHYRGIGASGPGGFSPVVDGQVLPADPFYPVAPALSSAKPLIVGWNEDEYTFFAMFNKDISGFSLNEDGLRKKLEPTFGKDTSEIMQTYRKSRPQATPTDLYVAIMSVTMMGLGSIEIAERKAEQMGASAYLYNFGYKSEVKVPGTDYPLGTPHAMDIFFKFNNVVPGSGAAANGMSGNRPERFEASRNFAGLWTSFARTGKPKAEGQPDWPAYNLKDRPTMRIDTQCSVIPDRYQSEREMWQSLGYLG